MILDDEDIDEDVGVYLENGCIRCRDYANEIEVLSDKIETLQNKLSHREHHLKVCSSLIAPNHVIFMVCKSKKMHSRPSLIKCIPIEISQCHFR